MKAYRVENQQKGHGIWRDFDGTVNPVFKHLTQGKCKDMPMEDSDFYRAEGKQWFSATDTPEKLKAWFSALDVKEMLELGYEIFEFDITNCRKVSEYEICFTRDSVMSQRIINPSEIYEELKPHTNYDKITSSADALAEFLELTMDCSECVVFKDKYDCYVTQQITCKECIKICRF
jgi:hypothetical protein